MHDMADTEPMQKQTSDQLNLHCKDPIALFAPFSSNHLKQLLQFECQINRFSNRYDKLFDSTSKHCFTSIKNTFLDYIFVLNSRRLDGFW